MGRDEGSGPEGRNSARKSLPPQSKTSLCQGILQGYKKSSGACKPVRTQQHGDHQDISIDHRRKPSEDAELSASCVLKMLQIAERTSKKTECLFCPQNCAIFDTKIHITQRTIPHFSIYIKFNKVNCGGSF